MEVADLQFVATFFKSWFRTNEVSDSFFSSDEIPFFVRSVTGRHVGT